MTEVIEIGSWEISISWMPWHSYLFAVIKYALMFYTAILFVAIILVLVRIQGSFKSVNEGSIVFTIIYGKRIVEITSIQRR